MRPNGPSRKVLLAAMAPLVVSGLAGGVATLGSPARAQSKIPAGNPSGESAPQTPVSSSPITGQAAAPSAAPNSGQSGQAGQSGQTNAAAAQAADPPGTAKAIKPKPVVHQQTVREASHEAATRASAGDYLGAINVWSRIVQHGPDRLQGYLQRAKLKRHIGDHKGAVQDLDLALQIYPNNAACLIERAAIRRRLGDNHGALEDLNHAIEAEPHKAEPYVDRGWLKMAMGDYVGSYTDYHAAVTINPRLKTKLTGMAQPHVSAHLDVGENGISAKSDRGVDSSADRDHKGRDSDEQFDGPFNEANHTGRHANYGSNYNSNYGAHLSGNKAHRTASRRITNPTQLARLNNEAVKEINDGQFEAAIKTLHELTDSAPDYAHARDNLTIAHNNWGLELAKRTPDQAARQFRQALYLDPSQGASRRNLDAMIKEIGKNPHDAADRLTLARENLSAGDKEAAFVEATEALKLKNSAEVRYMLRKILSALDDDDAEQPALPPQEKNHAHAKLSDNSTARSRQTNVEKSGEKSVEKIAAKAVEKNIDKSVEKIIVQPEAASGHDENAATIAQAKTMAAAGHVGEAEDLLNKLINEIKSRAAIDESSGFGTLEQALDAVSEMYLKTGSYHQAQEHLNELVSLRESTKAHDDPVLANTYKQYARVLNDLGRTAEAKTFNDKAEAILSPSPQSPTPPAVLPSSPVGN
ncbi:MAG: tetratricopeptide repeat protein [Cyanobacteria bacterium REEB67]|nr:tetratricopeptide repeat protein [Cyanobacteria bacterium REEB67]